MKIGINLFLSHNSSDKPFVRRVADDLESQGMDVWLDERKMKAGDSITDGITEGMSSYDVFLIFLSQKSVNAPWVKEELRIALNKRIRTLGKLKIIPIILEDCEIPLFLEDYIYVDFSKSEKYIDSFNILCDSIIFDDKLLLQYREAHPGNGLVERIFIDANISGNNYELITFKETHRIKAIRNASDYVKKLTIDGELIDVNFNQGSITKTQTSKSNWQLDMGFNKELRVGEVFEFDVFFTLKNEFQFENNWFFRIDSPTKQLKAKFKFQKECLKSRFYVRHIRGLGEMNRKYLPEVNLSNGEFEYEFAIDYPAYRDRYQFCW